MCLSSGNDFVMMNRKDVIFLLKGQIRSDLRSVRYNPDKGMYDIVFNSGKRFSYREGNCEVLEAGDSIAGPLRVTRLSDSTVLQCVLGGTPFMRKGDSTVKVWRVFFENGTHQDYLEQQLFVETEMKGEKGKDVFTYLGDVSRFSQIPVKEDVAISLRQKYERIGFIAEGTPLADYLEAGSCEASAKKAARSTIYRNLPGYPIFPFGCNNSQYKAVRNALFEKMSVIQGPPGTGKTQTILNIIANLLVLGKSVEVVSNNNSAVCNVVEKLEKYGFAWLVALLGNNENKKRFYDSQSGLYPDMSSWRCEDIQGLKRRIDALSVSLQGGYDALEKKALLEQELRDVRLQRENHLQVNAAGKDVCLWYRPKSSRGVLSVINAVESQVRSRGKLSLIRRACLMLRGLKLSNMPDLTSLETRYYAIREREIVSELSDLASLIENVERDSQQMQELSLQYLQGVLYERYAKYGIKRPLYQRRDVERWDANAFLEDYPIVLSTTFSAITNVTPNTMFDYLIMDEASQIDVAAGALALAVCRDAVVVGDEEQLPNVVTDDERAAARILWRKYDIASGYEFEGNSFLRSVTTVMPWVKVTLLKEHYRCAPSIIGFCNAQFYGNELVCMRGETQDGEYSSLRLCSTGEGNFARGTVNRRQAEMIVREVLPEVMKRYSDVGIIAPYNDQVSVIRDELSLAGYDDIQVDTVHKFQGRENDVIILSTVDNSVRAFVDDSHLVNVAVSRAKELFVLVVSGNEQPDSNVRDLMQYIVYHKGGFQESRLQSVFDLLYKEKAEQKKAFLKGRRSVSRFDSENLMWALLEDVLKENGYGRLSVLPFYPLRNLVGTGVELSDEEMAYAMHPWTHLDFLVYNKVTHEPVLAVEVDGTSYHFEGSDQARRDSLKNSVLQKLGLELLRLSTDGSSEREKILERLRSLGVR